MSKRKRKRSSTKGRIADIGVSSGGVRAVVYARVSSREQAEGYSLDAQVKLLDTYAKDRGLAVPPDHRFLEIESAGRTGRERFTEMVRFIRQHRAVRDVLVEKTDRLLRNLEDWVTIDDLDVRIHLVKEGEVISRESSSHQKLIHGIKVLLAKNYLENLSEEVKKGMVEAVSQGDWPHDVPVGYRRDTLGVIEHDPDKAPVVEEIFRRVARGVSLGSMKDWLELQSFTATKRGKRPIGKSQIERIIKNPFYAGLMRWKGRIYQGNHLPVVPMKMWDAANAALSSPTNLQGKRRPPKEGMTYWGIIRCKKCGCAVVGETKKGGRWTYYRCTHGKGNCDQGYVRAEVLDEQFREIVIKVKVDDELIEWIKRGLQESLDDETRFHEESVAELNKQLAQIKRWKNKVYEDRLEGTLAKDFWVQKMNELQFEEARIISEIEAHKTADTRYMVQGTCTLELTQRADNLWESLPASEKREMLQILLSNSYLKDSVVTAAYRQPFDLLVEMGAAWVQKKPGPDLSEPDLQMWRG